MTKRICFLCELEFKEGERQVFIPVERPYMNIILHETCHKIVDSNLIEYLSQNVDKWYTYWKKGGK